MNSFTKTIATLITAFGLMASAGAASADVANSVTAVQGYDVVSYQTHKRPIRGTGHFVSDYNGAQYLFATKQNKAVFDKNPKRYAPAYGGYCAFGVSVSKKFIGDPEVWRVVDNTLYLNLDENIQDLWLKDVAGNLKKANSNWKEIHDKAPADL